MSWKHAAVTISRHHWGRSLHTRRACRYCELNPNTQFASCSVPQELTNEEIDQEAAEVSAAAAAVVCCNRTVEACYGVAGLAYSILSG